MINDEKNNVHNVILEGRKKSDYIRSYRRRQLRRTLYISLHAAWRISNKRPRASYQFNER